MEEVLGKMDDGQIAGRLQILHGFMVNSSVHG